MEVLTSQPGEDLRARVPHHLYGCVDPAGAFDAARYARMAGEAVGAILARGKVPVLVGGSGLYLQALFGGLEGPPPPDPDVRARVAALTDSAALGELARADPAAPARIDTRNPRRVRRALEIVLQTGRPLAASRTARPSPMRGVLLVRPRAELADRIAATVDSMFPRDVVAEVRRLGVPGATASRAIGLADLRALLDGTRTRDEVRARMTAATTRYAKRQLTWFRNQTSLVEVILSATRPADASLQEALAAMRVFP
jgi:tRNA dimethylallyltransferase